MKILAVNGSPRAEGNTANLLQTALRQAEQVGHATELVQLSALSYKGCSSCLVCKLDKMPWRESCDCAMQDGLTDVLRKAQQADCLLLGSPVYFGNVTALMLGFLERLWFPANVYDESHSSLWPKPTPTGFILTMNLPQADLYQAMLQNLCKFQQRIIGPVECLVVPDTCQFGDYSRYYAPVFDSRHKEERRLTLEQEKEKLVGTLLESLWEQRNRAAQM